MLGLKSTTADRWLAQVDDDLPSILVDHAHCEKKAAGTAMNLLFAYGTQVPQLCGELSEIVVEELDHFRQVLALLEKRDIPYGAMKPSCYGRKLNDLVRPGERAFAIRGDLEPAPPEPVRDDGGGGIFGWFPDIL